MGLAKQYLRRKNLVQYSCDISPEMAIFAMEPITAAQSQKIRIIGIYVTNGYSLGFIEMLPTVAAS